MSDFLTGNPRCDKCGSHHPVSWDCAIAFVHAFEQPAPATPAEALLARIVQEQNAIHDHGPSPQRYRAAFGAIADAVTYLRDRGLYPETQGAALLAELQADDLEDNG